MIINTKHVDVTKDNFLIVAAKYYNNPQCTSTEEFYEDLNRIKYIKRLVNRYCKNGHLSHNLIMNHIVVFYNVFGIEIATKLFAVKMEYKYWPVIKPFLVYLNYIVPEDLVGIEMDHNVVKRLREI